MVPEIKVHFIILKFYSKFINKYLQKLAVHIHECGLVSYSWEGQVGMMGGGWDSVLGIL